MKFYKYHGTGNDFILLDEKPSDPKTTAQKLCDRHFGIGADGLIYAEPSVLADIKFNYYNSDGSIAPMCGNGMRCFVKFLMDEHLIVHNSFTVETLAGLISVNVNEESGLIQIDLGEPMAILSKPYVLHDTFGLEAKEIVIDGQTISCYTIFLGTLHTIVYENEHMDISLIGPKLSAHDFFIGQTNVNFVSVKNQHSQTVKTFERGAGWTLSCGTGTAASAVVSNQLGYTLSEVISEVPGGTLKVYVGKTIKLEGPAVKIASGIVEV